MKLNNLIYFIGLGLTWLYSNWYDKSSLFEDWQIDIRHSQIIGLNNEDDLSRQCQPLDR
jgi:hypothetical protein